eukprot:3229169-Pleurochrysis_carterae.AAC.1
MSQGVIDAARLLVDGWRTASVASPPQTWPQRCDVEVGRCCHRCSVEAVYARAQAGCVARSLVGIVHRSRGA